jgi:hypothetical protein
MVTEEIHKKIGLKFYCTDYDELDKSAEGKSYGFEVLDPKKVILNKLKYSF